MSRFAGGLDYSVSSLGSDLMTGQALYGDDDDDFNDSTNVADAHALLLKRLEDLDKMTATFLSSRVTELNFEHDSFTDLYSGDSQTFSLTIDTLSPDDVLCIAVASESDDKDARAEDDNASEDGNPNLKVILRLEDSIGCEFVPDSFRSDFSFTLTAAQGIIPGKYALTLTNTNHSSSSCQSARVSCSITPRRDAIFSKDTPAPSD